MNSEDVERFRAGDPGIFRLLVEEYSPRLLGYALHFTRDTDEAHDRVQDTWVRAYRKREHFDGRGSLLGWLLVICRTECFEAARRSSRRQAKLLRALPASDLDRSLESPASTEWETQGLDRDLAAALTELPEKQRDTFVLRILEDRSTREVAERLGGSSSC